MCITGCSTGLGHALAAELCARGDTVYAGVRDPADATRLPAAARALQLDVTLATDVADALARIEREAGRLDVLISNAAAHALGPWELVPDDVLRRVFEVNFFGAVHLVRAAVPLLRRGGGGTVLMVSSLSGLVGLPLDGTYAASKFALEAFAESLSYEVARWGIRVALVNPGGYATGLARRAWSPAADDLGPYEPLVGSLQPKDGSGNAADAAAAIARVVDTPGGPLRNAVDDTGRRVFRTLGADAQSERRALVEDASGLGWWIDGRSAPP